MTDTGLCGRAVAIACVEIKILRHRAARQAYVDLWAAVRDKSHVARTVHDQPALNLAAARFGDVQALPTNYNFRVSSRCEDAAQASGQKATNSTTRRRRGTG